MPNNYGSKNRLKVAHEGFGEGIKLVSDKNSKLRKGSEGQPGRITLWTT